MRKTNIAFLCAASLGWIVEANAGGPAAEDAGRFVGSLIKAASGDPAPAQQPQYQSPTALQGYQMQPAPQGYQPQMPPSAVAAEKQRVVQEKTLLANQAREQAQQLKMQCELASAKADLAKGSSRADALRGEANEICEDYAIALKMVERYEAEARIAALEAQAALYAEQQPPVSEPPKEPQQPQQSLPPPPELLSELPPAPEPEPEDGFEPDAIIPYEPTPVTGFELRLSGGFFYGAMGDSLESQFGPSVGLLAGYRGERVGIYASAQTLRHGGPDDSDREGKLYDPLYMGFVELHVYAVNNKPVNVAFNLGAGAGRFTFIEYGNNAWEEFWWDEYAPVAKASLELDIRLTRHLYIPVDLGGILYFGTSPNVVPFGFVNVQTGIGYVF